MGPTTIQPSVPQHGHTMRFCNSLACTVLSLWLYLQISLCSIWHEVRQTPATTSGAISIHQADQQQARPHKADALAVAQAYVGCPFLRNGMLDQGALPGRHHCCIAPFPCHQPHKKVQSELVTCLTSARRLQRVCADNLQLARAHSQQTSAHQQ